MSGAIPRPDTVYFHGLPGSHRELRLARCPDGAEPAVLDPLDFQALDRLALRAGPLRVFGFSLGAFSALRAAASRPGHVAELVLVSPAAPLGLGAPLKRMAGAPVFRLARSNTAGFAALTALQALAGTLAPHRLLKAMFAGSCAADRALLDQPGSVEDLAFGLKHALWHKAPLYRATVRAYVGDWENELSRVRCPCRIFHGELDDWVPLGMAEALAATLPQGAELHVEPGLGHYSTLLRVLPEALGG